MARRGFSLLELLVVVAIIGIMAAGIAALGGGAAEGQKLEAAGEMVRGELSRASARAAARNHPVEIRVYTPAGSAHLVAVVDVSDPEAPRFEGAPSKLPWPVVFDTNTTFSSLLGTGTRAGTEASDAPASIRGLPYKAFTVSPHGRTDLAPDAPAWTLTLRSQTATGADADRPASNFSTVVIDPVLGSVRVFRP